MKLDRTMNTLRNMLWGIINKLVITVVPFVLRTVFIYTLGAEYLGLNSLFTSILTVLNLAELGFSSAIVFNMYKPVAENDTNTICALMAYYKKIYRIIGILVSIIGICLIPFLGKLINGDVPKDINLEFLYILYLINTAGSYFLFAYKNCLLTVHQREDIISKVNVVLKIVMYTFQIVILVYFRNYYLYLFCMILNTIITNLVTAYYANKIYPEYKCYGTLSKTFKKEIEKNIKGLMVGKLCMVSRNAFDNIFLSIFLGLTTVTIYGNYYYIMNAISGILTIILTSMSAGIGNSVVTESVEKNYQDYNKFTFMYSWIAGWCTVCLFCLYQPFMEIWMGKELMFPFIDVILICIYFYSLTMGDVRSHYSAATGLFWENRVYVLCEAMVNIILNYFLGKIWGVHGIIIATWISIFFINFCWGSTIIFKHYFKQYSVLDFVKSHLFYFLNVILASIITLIITVIIKDTSIVSFLAKILICIVVPNLYFYMIYRKKIIFRNSVNFVKTNVLSKFNI